MKKKRVNINNIIRKRILFIYFISVFVFVIIGITLSNIMVIKKYNYLEKLANKTIVSSSYSAPRGRIYDRNYNLLVDNKAVKTIYYKREKNTTVEDMIKLSNKLSKVLDLDYSKVTVRMLKEYYLEKNKKDVDKLVTEEEYNKVYERKLTTNDIYNLKISRITDEMLNSMSIEDKKSSYIFYLMNKGYSYEEKVIKKEVSDLEYAYISENSDNLKGFSVGLSWDREYLYGDTFKGVLGTFGSIPEEKIDEYLSFGYELNDIVGTSYLELEYEDILKGEKEVYKIDENSNKKVVKKAKRGNDIVLSIDINLQKEVERIIDEEIIYTKKQPNTRYYNKSYVVLQDPSNGEILAMSGRKAINTGNELKIVDYTRGILTEPMTVGSVVKGASILVGYNTKAIDIGTTFYDSCIKIRSTARKCSWKNLGLINDIKALALSSNIYQFKTAMKVAGYEYSYNMPFKVGPEIFEMYRSMYHSFGLGVKTEIDLPIESLGYQGKDDQSGLLLDYVMGQYETYTPIQLSQYISTIANNGTRYAPRLLKEVYASSDGVKLGKKLYTVEKKELNKVNTEEKYLKRVQEGFYAVINASYGIGHEYIDTKYNPAGKTGTSESFLDNDNDGVIDTETISTAFIGYAPFDNPKITIAVTSPDVSYINSSSEYMTLVTRRISRKVTDKYFEMYPID
ncbi:MAG: peptidoglycan D,D-transpeptidase FtsI family protein [Bacilli bacterium]